MDRLCCCQRRGRFRDQELGLVKKAPEEGWPLEDVGNTKGNRRQGKVELMGGKGAYGMSL